MVQDFDSLPHTVPQDRAEKYVLKQEKDVLQQENEVLKQEIWSFFLMIRNSSCPGTEEFVSRIFAPALVPCKGTLEQDDFFVPG